MADRFRSYTELRKVYQRGVHYDVRHSPGEEHADILVMAPHGGKIERRTAEIAEQAAGKDYSCYVFEGRLEHNNKDELHITSEFYDVPEALEDAARSRIVIAIHGRLDYEDPTRSWMGGLDTASRDIIGTALEAAGFGVNCDPPKFKGVTATNICNRGSTGAGVQLEIPLYLRKKFEKDADHEMRFANAIRAGIKMIIAQQK